MNSHALVTLVAIIRRKLASIYGLRRYFLVTRGSAIRGQNYGYYQRVSEFASRMHNVYTFQRHAGELLPLITKTVGCKQACLLFSEVESEDFVARFVEPKAGDNPLSGLALSGRSPIVRYLEKNQKLLVRQDLDTLPEFRDLREQEKDEMKSSGIEVFVPLIGRDRLMGILGLDKKQSGKYTLDDFNLLENTSDRIAISMEKAYFRELEEREGEQSVINRSSAILASSLDIQRIYDSFVEELKKVVDISWAAIVLIEDSDFCFLALSPETGSALTEGLPIKGTGTEWVATHKETVIESDLSQENRFVTGESHLKQGIRTIAYMPLMGKDGCIGSLVVASGQPNAYSQRHIELLEQLASQIVMPIENSRLYAKAEERARIDDLTGLLNRRALDEAIASEIARHSRYGGDFSLIILDLDSFKAFNDNHGHLAGDKLLREAGSIMKRAIRSSDQAYRYGGDEFAVVLPQTNCEAALDVAERVRKRVASEVDTGYVPITASLGLASWPIDGTRPNEIIAAADAALYLAKLGGGNLSRCALRSLSTSDDTTVAEASKGDDGTLNTVFALAAKVDEMDNYTRSHSKKVKEYAVILAEALNLEPPEISRLETCALLHDIGKISLADKILGKQGKLTAEEWEAIRSHSEMGANIISHIHQLTPCIPGILHHHERYDGSGYPQGLKGEDIPLDARILAVADAFVAMTSDRPYRDALSLEEALQEIRRGAGKHFDPDLVDTFLMTVRHHCAASVRETMK